MRCPSPLAASVIAACPGYDQRSGRPLHPSAEGRPGYSVVRPFSQCLRSAAVPSSHTHTIGTTCKCPIDQAGSETGATGLSGRVLPCRQQRLCASRLVQNPRKPNCTGHSRSGMRGASDPAWPKATTSQEKKQFTKQDDTSPVEDTVQKLSQLNLAAESRSVSLGSHGSSAPLQQLPLSSCDLAGIADYILSGKARKIVIMAGAGISVSSGIPDFRTPGTGLYSQLERFNLPWPEAVFDIRFFRHNPKPFYMLAKELFPGGYMPTPAHYFMRLLHDKGLLLTAFTQNVDGLEQLTGLSADKVVQAHGSFDDAHCIDCGRSASIYAVQQAVFDDDIATCTSCGGLVKPDIVFFGEPLPARFHRRRLADMQQADLLIVMGSSLVVQPFASMIDAVPDSAPRLLINMNKVGEQKSDTTQQQQAVQQIRNGRRRLPRDSDSSSSSDSDSQDDAGSCSGFESDVIALTASSSGANLSADSIQLGTSSSNNDCKHAAVLPQQQSPQRSGFDFGAGVRDVAHLSSCDDGVMQLARLLGWEDELQELIRQGAEEFEAARREWED